MRRKGNSFIKVGIVAVLAGVLAGCSGNSSSTFSQSNPIKVTQQMSWFAQPEMGGHFAAEAGEIYKKAGLEVTIQQGGPQVSNVQLVASGKVDFAMSQADEVILARQEGIPIVAIYANLQTNPQTLIYHKSSGIQKITDLNGKNVYVATGFPYWKYLAYKYKLDKVQIQTYNGSLTGFIADKNAVQQGYATNEPFVLKAQGIDVDWFLNADLGYNPYGNVVITTEKMIKEQPEVIKAYLKATTEGWDYYYNHSDEVNQLINTYNKDYMLDHLAFAQDVAKEFVFGGDAVKNGVGYMSEERWKTLVDQMKEAGMVTKDIPLNELYTNDYLPAKQ
ncbi:ABC transporter substrate-binding protein [Paenibacillus ihuae]|uniref:ABC transporter substrate-binding protein n=1 Tax=Paenibacillus ihuae TaxID=1232431 RepID=UPI0006D54314|nr:ABC transporter substrate-binding protein [Paenibacillus ihuae]